MEVPKVKNPPKPQVIRTIPGKGYCPKSVPDNKRPLSGSNLPGGNPPAGIKPGWRVSKGNGVKLHTHS